MTEKRIRCAHCEDDLPEHAFRITRPARTKLWDGRAVIRAIHVRYKPCFKETELPASGTLTPA